MSYSITFTPAARRRLKKLDPSIQRRLIQRIRTLATEPRPSGVRKLSGRDTLYRIRVGRYRIIYQARDAALTILIVRVGDRKDVYRRIEELLDEESHN